MDGPEAYTGLGHRMPGAYAYKGPIQDWRYYHQALNAEQIYEIAMDTTGPAQRTCELWDEPGGDSTYTDILGHDCAWYAEKRRSVPTICSATEVQNECPLACGTKKPCWEGDSQAQDLLKSYTIWSRIQHMTEHAPGAGVICVREGIDIVQQCRNHKANPDAAPPAAGATHWESTKTFGPKPFMDIDVSDCDKLSQVVNPYCSFHADWTKKINPEITAGGGYTIEFWWKAKAGTVIPVDNADYQRPEAMRRMVFFSKVSPQRVILTIEFRSNFIDTFMHMYGTCASWQSEAMDVPGKYETGVWYHTAAVLGAKNEDGKIGQIIMQGSRFGFDFADWGWCMNDENDFIEAIQLPGGVLFSPIIVTPRALPVKQLQQNYYAKKQSFSDLRHGPSIVDEAARKSMTLEYVMPTFSYAAALVSPPLVLQERTAKTDACKNALGSEFQKILWENTLNGSTCAAPFDCGDLASDSRILMACSSDEPPAAFFGQHEPISRRGRKVYFEFLQSITDAPVLWRNNEAFRTSSYIDFQTKRISLEMVAFSPEYGIASKIEIVAELKTSVRMDYFVTDFQSVEGERLKVYRNLMICAVVLSLVILVEKVYTLKKFKAERSVLKKIRGTGKELEDEWRKEKRVFIVDVCIQVVLPVLYFVIRFAQLSLSKNSIQKIMGTQGLSGVPWASKEVALENKIHRFFSHIADLDSKMHSEFVMQVFYFVFASAELLRLILQTEVHPRTAILVKTFKYSASNVLHFTYLLFMVLVGYMCLAIAQFSDDRHEFSEENVFETLWTLMMGDTPSKGSTRSHLWTVNPLLLSYRLMFVWLLHFFMLNTIIAIIGLVCLSSPIAPTFLRVRE